MNKICESIFRDYEPKESMRSDRSAGDRARHNYKVKQKIKDGLADVVAEESLIGQSGDKKIKIPIRSIKEFRFVFGDNGSGAAQGDGKTGVGQVVGKTGQGVGEGPGKGQGKPGDQAGEDIYETEITLDELTDLLFEEMELPNLQRKAMKQIDSLSRRKKDGFRHQGIEVRLDKKRTAKERIKRKHMMQRHGSILEDCEDCEGTGLVEENNVAIPCEACIGIGQVDKRVRFLHRDRRYRHFDVKPKPESNAVIIAIMDTSGSMDTMKKYLARSFFYFLYLFIRSKYQKTEMIFIAHHTEAKEVDEHDFFHKGESGGTMISSGYKKALEVITDRYNPSLWNIYIFHASDGDNYESDNDTAIKSLKELIEMCNLVGYGEIKPEANKYFESSMMSHFKNLANKKFVSDIISSKTDIWPVLKKYLSPEFNVAE